MFQQDRMEAFYLDSSPLSDLSDLDGGWSPVSGFSDQENFAGMTNSPLSSLSNRECNSTLGLHSLNLKAHGGMIHKRSRNPVRKTQQRNAANQRERKRMKIINDAFDGLRDRIPLECNDRKLSKVDTLRLAIRYIQQLSDMVEECGTGAGGVPGSNNQIVNERIIIRCHNQGYEDLAGDEDYHQVEQYTPLYGHSLSWQDSKEQVPTSYPGTDTHKLSAKLWMPHLASPEDLALLNETSP